MVQTNRPLRPVQQALRSQSDTQSKRRVVWQLNTILLGVLIAFSMFIAPGGGVAPVDFVLVAIAGHGLLSFAHGERPSPEISSAFKRIILTVALFALAASISALVHGGVVTRLLSDLASFGYILAPLALLGNAHRGSELKSLSYLVGGLASIFAVIALTQQSERATGLMANPNMAATWLGLAFVMLAFGRMPVPLRFQVPTGGLLLVALVATDSYAALLALAFVASYLLYSSHHRVGAILFAGSAAGIVGLYPRQVLAALPEADRLERSREGRVSIWDTAWQTWEAHPMGIGHGNFVREQIYGGGVEVHNDYLNALVENGIAGLLAILAIGFAVWRSGGRMTRAMLIFVAFTAFFHNQINFRHVWIFLALGIAIDIYVARANRSRSTQVDRSN